MNRFLIWLVLLSITNSCGNSIDYKLSTDELASIKSSIDQDRIEKNKFFTSAESPLSDSLKALFHGLDYYAFDSAYVFSVKLERNDKPRELDMITSKGKLKHYIEYGYFEFDRGGLRRLSVYRPQPAIDGHADYLFVPFKDITNGKESYAAGRYIELTLKESTNDYLLDFNSAYNPWCAYSDDYNCPYPPKENHLSISVHAGEKKFRLKEH